MEGEIVNRVANSPIITVNLEDWYVPGPRHTIDLSQWLEEGLILREKPFRTALAAHPWETYRNGLVCLQAPLDVVIPIWAYMLLGSYLESIAKKVVVGSSELLETVLFQEQFHTADLSIYENRPVIIKGCSKYPVPLSAYVWAIEKIQGVAKSVLFGEACSAVPIYKKK
ncbi:MAG: hypothetical protein RLZZ241_18 [Bacteroidota bacterium]|jgi:hypothetical protein